MLVSESIHFTVDDLFVGVVRRFRDVEVREVLSLTVAEAIVHVSLAEPAADDDVVVVSVDVELSVAAVEVSAEVEVPMVVRSLAGSAVRSCQSVRRIHRLSAVEFLLNYICRKKLKVAHTRLPSAGFRS